MKEKNGNKGDSFMQPQENLSNMLKHGVTEERVTFNEDQVTESTAPSEEVSNESMDPISVTSLSNWFDSNVNNFPNIRKPTMSVTGVDPNEQLIITVLVSNEGGVEKRKIVVYDDAHIQPVLNIPAVDMQIYNNGFRIIYNYGNGIYIKGYGIRTGLFTVFCYDINNILVPYATVRIKKRDTDIDVLQKDPEYVRQKLTETLDFEALQLRYKQSAKTEGFRTNFDAIKWLVERQGSIEDVHHHIQIDNVIIDTLE